MIKRMPYGLRDDAHFFLEVRAALLEIGR